MPTVALVLVSHSRAAAEGVAEIAAQMAPDVTLLPAGGIDDGIGTDFARILEALESASGSAAGVVVLTDLGSAVLTTESVLEALDEDVVAAVRVADAPFLEGAVAAAVAAQQGEGLDAVLAAAQRAGALFAAAGSVTDGSADDPGRGPGHGAVGAEPDGQVTRTVVLRNPLGLHARPAAVVARAVADGQVPLTIDGVNGASVLELMAMGATGGQELAVTASGPGAQEAVDRVVDLLGSGFGEV